MHEKRVGIERLRGGIIWWCTHANRLGKRGTKRASNSLVHTHEKNVERETKRVEGENYLVGYPYKMK